MTNLAMSNIPKLSANIKAVKFCFMQIIHQVQFVQNLKLNANEAKADEPISQRERLFAWSGFVKGKGNNMFFILECSEEGVVYIVSHNTIS
jgi:hypothetical protein